MTEEENKHSATSEALMRALSKIEATKYKLNYGLALSSEEKNEILRKRAEELSIVSESEEKKVATYEIIQFSLAYENYAFESKFVKEVYPVKDLTYLTNVPPFVLGIINVRGQIVSVLDIKKFFGLPDKGLTNLNKVIILYNDEMEFGIMADAITRIHTVDETEIQVDVAGLGDKRKEYLKGITRDRVVFLDAEKLLNDKSLIINDEIL